MNKKICKDFIRILSVAIATCSLVLNTSDAASRTAVRGSVASRRPVASTTRTGTTTNPVTTETPATTETTPEPVPETAPAPEPEPEVFENKTAQFNVALSEVAAIDGDNLTSDLAEQIRKQRAAAEARDDLNIAISNLQKSSKSGKNTCDAGLRQCMQKNCGEDFTKCATDGDTLFGDKLNKCRRETTCTGEEFRLFTTEIKADRDMNVKLSSYNAVINCGNNYNSCIQKECGQTFEKCLGKTAADNAVKKCATTAKNCTEQDSGLAARFGNVIGGLRLDAEQDVTNDEKRLLELRNLMRKQCEHLGAMFDERSFDCVYTVNFFAGTNQSSPMASRKLYAGDTFICTQEWFGTNVTTFKENAYRETRAQTGASSAMLGSGLGTAAGLISSGAITRALNTQEAKKDLKSECTAQGGTLKNGECKLGEDSEKPDPTINTQETIKAKVSEIKKSLGNASLYGREISFTQTEKNYSEVSAELSKWEKRCKEAKVEGRVKAADVKETTSGDKVVWKCVATKCDDSGGIKYALKDGDCVPTSDTGQNIIDAFGEKYIPDYQKKNN